MSITEFKTYLACPYRYALAKLLGLETLDDSAPELDPLTFGTLAHDALCAFGRNEEINRCEQPEQIEKFLAGALRKEVQEQFGASPLPAVQVQIARLQHRLGGFSRLQAALNHEGWRIRHCELRFGKQWEYSESGERVLIADTAVPLDVPGQAAMLLHGSIDRIDFNERTGAWRIIDYKTSESATGPCQAHHNRKSLPANSEVEWFDLQMPLYHYLATRGNIGMTADAKIELAYLCLPKRSEDVDVLGADWTAAHLHSAWDTAREIVRNIRAGKFELNREYAYDAFPRICQTSTFREDEGEDEDEDGAET